MYVDYHSKKRRSSLLERTRCIEVGKKSCCTQKSRFRGWDYTQMSPLGEWGVKSSFFFEYWTVWCIFTKNNFTPFFLFCFVRTEGQAIKRLRTASSVKMRLIPPGMTTWHVWVLWTQLTRMKYFSASVIDASYNLRKSADRKEKLRKA